MIVIHAIEQIQRHLHHKKSHPYCQVSFQQFLRRNRKGSSLDANQRIAANYIESSAIRKKHLELKAITHKLRMKSPL